MRYIEKHYDTPTVIQHEQELASVNLDEASLLKREETEKLDGNLLYKEQIRSTEYIPHWKDLQAQMCQDQGGVCCYCGLKLHFQIRSIIVLNTFCQEVSFLSWSENTRTYCYLVTVQNWNGHN